MWRIYSNPYPYGSPFSHLLRQVMWCRGSILTRILTGCNVRSSNIYCFTSRSRIFHLYGDVTITGEWLQNLGLCSALMAFEQGVIFIPPHLLWHGASVFFCLIRRTALFSLLLGHTRGCLGASCTCISRAIEKDTEARWERKRDRQRDEHGFEF
jgi:hypothetical protein